MSRVWLGLLLLLGTTVHAENVLHVKAGEQHALSADAPVLTVDKLILEDGAVLRVPAGMEQLQLNAAWAEIGNNVSILAQGQDGVAGKPGQSIEEQAKECEAGQRGGDGTHGTQGKEGVSITLSVGLVKLGSLVINSRGGAGGAGGAGGQGQPAGVFDKCNAPAGGEGGAGGDGGDGGNGGQVSVVYRLLPGHSVSEPVTNAIRVQNGGGNGGEGGAAGAGGAGTEGKYINMRTLSGNRKWMAGGAEGAPGAAGKPGRDGVKGQTLVQQDIRDRMDAMIQTQSAQVAALKDQLVTKLAEEKRQVEEAAKQAISALELQVNQLQSNMAGAADQTTVEQTLQQQSARIDDLGAKLEQAIGRMNQQMQAMDQKLEALSDKVDANVSSAAAP